MKKSIMVFCFVDILNKHSGQVKKNLLLLKRSKDSKFLPDMWNTPGGKVDDGESFLETALRECEEEMGFIPRYLEETNVCLTADGYFSKVFVAHLDHSELVKLRLDFFPNREHSEFRWIEVDQVCGTPNITGLTKTYIHNTCKQY